MTKLRVTAVVLAAVLGACPGNDTSEPRIADGIFSALGDVYPAATDEQKLTFERGRAVAMHRFTRGEGLGPQFNVTFCAACHEKPSLGGSSARYRNFLLVGQVLPDGTFNPTGVAGVQDQYTFAGGSYVPLDSTTNLIAIRNPIPMFGSGFIAEIPDAEILALSDPDDSDGDGISGRPNYDRGFVGRFGRKSQTVSIEGFIRGPLFNHLGITSNPLSDALRAALPVASPAFEIGSALVSPGTLQQAQAAAPDEPNVDDDGVSISN
ncbi:MAG: di-heme oxidoredictase family protein [Myxococcota bacterium]